MKKIIIFSLSVFAVLGLIKVFSIIPFNRMAADDFAYANMVAAKGFWGAQIAWYTGWTGRFTSTFLQTLFGVGLGSSGRATIYSLITFVALIFAFTVFYARITGLKILNLKVLLLSCASFVMLYVLTPDKKESWYWLSGSVTYLWPIILLIFGVSYLFVKKYGLVEYVLSFILVFLSGGSNETFSLITATVLFVLVVYSFIIKRWNKLMFVMLIASLASFLFVYLAPGNAIRTAGGGSNPMSLLGSIIYAIQTGPGYLYSIVLNNAVFIIPLGICLSYLFSTLSTDKNLSKEESLKNIFYLSIAPILLSIVYMLPAFKILGRVQPERSDITLSLLILISLLGVAYYASHLIKFKTHTILTLIFTVSAIVLIAVSFKITSTLGSDFYIAKNYSDTFDKIVSELKNAKESGKHGTVIVGKIPESGLIGSADLKGYPDYEKNYAMAKFYGLDSLISK